MKIAFLLLFLFSSTYAFSEINSFENWLEKEMISFHHEENHEENSFQSHLSGPWALDKIRFIVRPLFALEIPALASLEIKPFIEFHWKASSP